MKKFILLFILFVSFQTQFYGQAYVKFAKEPKTVLMPAKSYNGYAVSYKALKKSTIYLELKQGNRLVGMGVYLINKPGTNTVNIAIKVLEEIRKLTPAANYSYHLYMYEGNQNDWSRKACKTKIINNVKMIGSGSKKRFSPSFINTFN